jgi:uncharacterized protein (DUF362 family)
MINKNGYRRSFLRSAIFFPLLSSKLLRSTESYPDVVMVQNAEPDILVQKAIKSLGGIRRFVKPGQTVLVKPNIGWDRAPEQAADTNPLVVAEIVRMCLNAGAKRVLVLDRTCNQARRCYKNSGIEQAAENAGAQVRHIIESKFTDVKIHNSDIISSWPIYQDALKADVLINVPIIKHHSLSKVTLGFKNLMGLIGGNRGNIHTDFMTKIVDINLAIKPTLTILDGYRVLMRNGPSGGNPEDVVLKKTVVAGTDRVAADAVAAQLLGVQPNQLDYLKIAAKKKLGTLDVHKVDVRKLTL